MRVLAYLRQSLPFLTQGQLQRAFDLGWIQYDGKTISRNVHLDNPERLTFNDCLKITELKPQADLSCEVLFKDDNFIFFDKPANMPSVAQCFWETGTVANWLLSQDVQLKNVSSPLESGLLHRLDTATQGVMVTARTTEAFSYYRDVWNDHVIKEYEAMTARPLRSGIYEAYAINKNKGSAVIAVSSDEGDRVMKTEILSCQPYQDVYQIRIRLHTGVRHQIRAHLAFLGAPIIGDALYEGQACEVLQLYSKRIIIKDENGKTRYDVHSNLKVNLL